MKTSEKKKVARVFKDHSRAVVLFLILVVAGMPNSAQSQSPKDYVVGAGDVLDIKVWDNADIDRIVEVSQEGAFTFPFVGKIKASDMTVFQIERELVRKLSDGYLVAPQVSITVSEYRNWKVFLFGEIKNPGSYILKHRYHLLELIAEAGGFTEQRGLSCVIVRPEARSDNNLPISINDAKKSEIIEINLDQLISGEPSAEPFYVMPGDHIYINQSEAIFVTGEVRKPGQLKWEKGMTVREAVSLAGGGTPRAAVSRTRVIRNEDGVEKEFKPGLGDPVQPGDIIKVPESFF